MKTFILIHGAWHNSFVWDNVKKQLLKLGHKVHTPDLPGHRSNKIQDFKKITLADYILEVAKLLLENDSIILVGHSMAGIIISQLAENFPEKIHKLVYLTAFIPDNNGCLLDEEKKAINPSVALEAIIDTEKSLISIKDSPKFKELFYNNCTAELYAKILPQIVDQPLEPFLDKVCLTQDKFGQVKKLYIECLDDKAISIQDQRRMQQKFALEVKSLKSDHSPFFTDCDNLVKILAAI